MWYQYDWGELHLTMMKMNLQHWPCMTVLIQFIALTWLEVLDFYPPVRKGHPGRTVITLKRLRTTSDIYWLFVHHQLMLHLFSRTVFMVGLKPQLLYIIIRIFYLKTCTLRTCFFGFVMMVYFGWNDSTMTAWMISYYWTLVDHELPCKLCCNHSSTIANHTFVKWHLW